MHIFAPHYPFLSNVLSPNASYYKDVVRTPGEHFSTFLTSLPILPPFFVPFLFLFSPKNVIWPFFCQTVSQTEKYTLLP